ncbi:hypothetical protein NL50_01275 [Clostridium acetobutylicum]|nr:hypothetical protein NL50_01275 [Clostridium acetobutylicum]
MYYINLKQERILKFIEKFGVARIEHMKRILNIKDIDKQFKILIRQRKVKLVFNDICILNGKKDFNIKMIKALDLYSCLYLNNGGIPVEWCMPQDFPFTIAFFRNSKVFDVAVINEGEENIYSSAINRGVSERVIAVISEENQKEKIKINKQIKCCTIEDGVVNFF